MPHPEHSSFFEITGDLPAGVRICGAQNEWAPSDLSCSDRQSQLARSCLQKMWPKEAPPLDRQHIDFPYIAPPYSYSLSHSYYQKTFHAIAALAPETLAIGIDLENRERTVSLKARKFYHHTQDRHSPKRTDIEVWCLKEAAFKAICQKRRQKEKIFLSDIWLCEMPDQIFQFGHKNDKGQGLLLETPQLTSVVALAIISDNDH